MPELHFKGKEYVYNHHLTVPFRPLEAHPDKSIGDESENLIIHGDNLHALKALLPRFAGKVDCIFIDPPYNTGNENWNYNDNVNSPMIKEWLDGNPVNKEDMLRHDKWLCMMYPRWKLLYELLSDSGSLWMTLDDNEVHRAKLALDEIFGDENFIANLIWEKTTSARNDATLFSGDHDHLLVYCRSPASISLNRMERTVASDSAYSNPDDDPRGDWREGDYKCAKSADERPNLYYPIANPTTGEDVWPRKERVWAYSKEETERNIRDDKLWWGKTGNYSFPKLKRFRADAPEGLVPRTLWKAEEVTQTRTARVELQQIFDGNPFPTPKPIKLVQRIIELATNEDSIVLDSFAGSATTGHAVLAQNSKDKGSRTFILVECEDYADTLTAERVRRVINGYEYQGTQKEELLRQKITWSNFGKDKAHKKLLDQVQSIDNLESGRFDAIKKTIKGGELIITGETRITDKVEGLGGGFTYYTLGNALDLDKMLTGESLPDYASVGAWLFHTATGEPLDLKGIEEKQSYLGESAAFHVWLIYKPELDFLKSRDAALTLSVAAEISEKKKDKRHLIFAPARFVPNKMLLPLGVEYAPLPFALYRFEKG